MMKASPSPLLGAVFTLWYHVDTRKNLSGRSCVAGVTASKSRHVIKEKCRRKEAEGRDGTLHPGAGGVLRPIQF